jgi:hypothetical protein
VEQDQHDDHHGEDHLKAAENRFHEDRKASGEAVWRRRL